jgi:hypothetical protein
MLGEGDLVATMIAVNNLFLLQSRIWQSAGRQHYDCPSHFFWLILEIVVCFHNVNVGSVIKSSCSAVWRFFVKVFNFVVATSPAAFPLATGECLR